MLSKESKPKKSSARGTLRTSLSVLFVLVLLGVYLYFRHLHSEFEPLRIMKDEKYRSLLLRLDMLETELSVLSSLRNDTLWPSLLAQHPLGIPTSVLEVRTNLVEDMYEHLFELNQHFHLNLTTTTKHSIDPLDQYLVEWNVNILEVLDQLRNKYLWQEPNDYHGDEPTYAEAEY